MSVLNDASIMYGQAKPIVLFRQGGNNLRVGNTLVWLAAGYGWCLKNGFEFYFPAAHKILGRLLSQDSLVFSEPKNYCDWPVGVGIEDRYPHIDSLLLKILSVAKGDELSISRENKIGVSLVPGALGCIVNARGCAWYSDAVVDFVRAHRVTIVDEPYPFSVAEVVPSDLEAALLRPSDEVRELLRSMKISTGLSFGVHVRQTDYRRWQGGKFFRDNEFYNGFISGLLSILPSGSRVVVANDGEFVIDPCLLASGDISVSRGSKDDVVSDIVSFSACDILFGPPSTFTAQALRLGNLWLPKRRSLLHLREGDSLQGVIRSVTDRVGSYLAM